MIRCGLVGFGKIAQDEHVPAIARTQGIELVAVASRNARCDGVANYPNLDAMLAGEPTLDAIILCQPPQVRFAAAKQAILAGKHVFLEKPPGATLSEIEMLCTLAKANNVVLYASWHSRFSPPVAALREKCAGQKFRHIAIEWKEDVRRWHPGQDWIWEAGGFGVLDPGINALSILTEVLAEPVRVLHATLDFPSNKSAPIAASLSMETATGVPVSAAFDWRQTGRQIWQIEFKAEHEKFTFNQNGDDAASVALGEDSAIAEEYRAMYQKFVGLVGTGISDVDLAPLRLVADAFMVGAIRRAEAFYD